MLIPALRDGLGNVRTCFVCIGSSRSHLFHLLDLFIKCLILSVGALIRNSMVRIDSQYGRLFSQHSMYAICSL